MDVPMPKKKLGWMFDYVEAVGDSMWRGLILIICVALEYSTFLSQTPHP